MERFVLDSYAARSCPVKVHHRFDPTVTRPVADVPEPRPAFPVGPSVRSRVLDRIAAHHPTEIADLRPLDDARAQLEASLEAMRAGVRYIIRPLLPRDWLGHRSGRPDLLVRDVDQSDQVPGYVPVITKSHRILELTAPEGVSQLISTIERPDRVDAVSRPGVAIRSNREPDLIQLAHFWRLLAAAGFAAAGDPIAGIIGSDQLPEMDDPVISWVRLTDKTIRTFATTSHDLWRLHSPLSRYDHEHNFRVKVAEVAARRALDPTTPAMVQPIRVSECDRCIWWQVCEPQLASDDISKTITKSPLDVREITTLRSLGIESIGELAGIDLDEFLPRYLPKVAHREAADTRIRTAHHRARLMARGIELERINSEPIDLPRHDLEIDLDIETSVGNRVYLWGFLVDDHRTDSTPVYHSFARFEDLTDQSEYALARLAMTWLLEITRGRDAAIYHYSIYELTHADKLAADSKDPRIAEGATRLRAKAVDLFTCVRTNFFGTQGLGLKAVARSGARFEWRDDDPGGLNSQRWFDDAVHLADADEREASRRRVLEYNEDDVRATHALRAWLRTNPGDTGPGSVRGLQ